MKAGLLKELLGARSAAKSLVTRLTRLLWSPYLTDSERALLQARLLTARQMVADLRRQISTAVLH